MSRLTWDGTAEPVSRDLLGANGDREMLTTSRIGNLTRLIYTLLNVLTMHMHIFILKRRTLVFFYTAYQGQTWLLMEDAVEDAKCTPDSPIACYSIIGVQRSQPSRLSLGTPSVPSQPCVMIAQRVEGKYDRHR